METAFHARILIGEGVRATSAGTVCAEKVGSNDDETLGGELVGHFLHPVAEAEDLVNHDDDGRLLFDFGIDDHGVDVAAIVGEGGVLAMAGRGIETALGPVLGGERGSGQSRQGDCEAERTGKHVLHGGEKFIGD